MTARLEAIERAMVDAISERDEAALGPERRDAWLAERGLEPADRDAFAAQSDTSFRVYRVIVQKTLKSAILVELPRTARLLGERFDRDVEGYLAELPRSHYLRDLAFELFDAASPGWRADPALPPFASDLARHELSAYEIGSWIDDVGAPVADEELDLAMPVRIGAGARIYRYGYPVHELAEGATTLERRDTILLAYRDREHDVRYLSLTPLAAEIFERLAAHQPLGAAITGGCATRDVVLDDGVLADVSALLADLADRGILLGSATAPKT